MRPRLRCGLLVGAVAAVVLTWQPPEAQAHTRTQETTNVVARIVETPDIDGLSWTVHTGGLLVEVDNRSGGTLTIEGYEGEPYLRIGPDGVAHNRRSAATYLNDERLGTVTLPPAVDRQAPAEWVAIDAEPRVRWHDHRTHWMSTRPPGFVETGPVLGTLMELEMVGPVGTAGDGQGRFQDWEIPRTFEGEDHVLRGVMEWHDPPPAWPWLTAALLLLAPGLVGLRRVDLVARIRPAALMVGAVAAVNAIHLVDDLVAFPSDLLDELFGLLHTSLFLGVGLAGAAWAWWSDSGRVLALAIASGGVLYHQGLVHLPMLFASDFPTVWPQALVRLTVALGLVQAVVVAAVLIARPRDGASTPRVEADRTEVLT
jgi:hypothetical protein